MAQPVSVIRTAQGPQVGPYIFGKTLGAGSTGKVKLAKNLETGEMVAIKIVRKDFLERKPSLKKKMRREISVLKLLSHPNVMGLIDVFEIETHLFLVMEYVDGLELFEYLVRRGALPPAEALGFFHQIICGLEYCHNRLICHRDLKPENLLLDRHHTVKIADFGMTSLNPPGSLLETSCGSPHYCDPCVVSGERYDGLKADWSCGVILYAMVTGRLPFDDDNIQRLLVKVQAGQFHMPPSLPEALRDLIRRMLTVDPDARITLDGIKAHPWFNMFPPRYYPHDDFQASPEPMLDPDPRIVSSLADLGWGEGNVENIVERLRQPGVAMEKVFYSQLQRHRMFSPGGTLSVPAPKAGEAVGPTAQQPQPPPSSSTTMSAGARAEPATAVPSTTDTARTPSTATTNLEQSTSAVRDGTTKPTAPADNGTIVDGMSRVTVNAPADAPQQTGTDASTKSPSTLRGDGAVPTAAQDAESDPSARGASLVRQSELVRSATDSSHQPADDDNTVEAAIENEGGVQRSWFDSVREYLTGQGDENGTAPGRVGPDGALPDGARPNADAGPPPNSRPADSATPGQER